MLTIVLAALTAVQSAAPAVIERPLPVATIVAVAPPATTSDEHIALAKKALEMGDFAEARREYVIASALDRDAGRLPAAADFGLAHVLYAQGYEREAAIVLDRLAADAQAKGDRNTEARALVDAMWLANQTRQFTQARSHAIRIRTLLKDPALSPDVRKEILERIS